MSKTIIFNKNFKWSAVINPLLFGIYPILFLYHRNIKTIPFDVIVLPLILGSSFALIFWLLVYLLVKNFEKSGLIATIFLILFYSYGPFWFVIRDREFGIFKFENHFYTLFLCAVIFIAVTRIILKSKKKLFNLTRIFNLIGLILVAYNIFLIGYQYCQRNVINDPLLLCSSKPNKKPDIYYIILDGYGRYDVLKNFFYFTNDFFLEYLKSKGFCVASKSKSNYALTELSIASSLNFTYINDLVELRASDDMIPFINMIRKNKISKFFKMHGYKLFTFSTAISSTEIRSADKYFAPRLALSDFENLVINTTPLLSILNNLQYRLHKNRINFIFNKFTEIAKISGPKFVFAHIYAPHPPFVLGLNNDISCNPNYFSLDEFILPQREYAGCYTNQLISLNDKFKNAIEGIINNSAEPPVIILHGDHGPRSLMRSDTPIETRVAEVIPILLACYLPEIDCKNFLPSITPVNIFRLILRNYFGSDIEILEDKSYYSFHPDIFNFIDVTDNKSF